MLGKTNSSRYGMLQASLLSAHLAYQKCSAITRAC